MKATTVVLLLCLLLGGVLCAQGEADPYADLWARLDGSTATIPLSEAIIMDRLGIDAREAAARIDHQKTYEAYQALLTGDKDLILVPLPEAWELAHIAKRIEEQQGEPFVMPELTYTQVVREALIFITNVANPVTSLTQQELRDIYTGRITHWSQVRGEPVAIKPFQRNSDSGSQTCFLQLLMQGEEPMPAVASLTHDSMGYLAQSIAAYDNRDSALGYSMFFYVTQMFGKENLRLLAVDGVEPSRESIASGAYPLVTGYYAVHRSDLPEAHPARRMVAWLLSPEGQAVACQSGYVPMASAAQ